MRRISVEERRARLWARHHMAAPVNDAVQVARDLAGLHGTDPASVFLAVAARTTGLGPAHIEDVLYEQRALARVLGMRRTMFVVPSELTPVLHAACARALAERERKRIVRFVQEAGITGDGERWLLEVERATLAALARRGEATAAELSEDVPALREKVRVGIGKRWEGSVGVSTRVLFLLAAEGRIIRARPRGSWVSGQYRWAIVSDWLDIDVDVLSPEAARTELVRRWLAAYGPATFDDLRWWTGWTVTETRRVLAAVDPEEVDLGGVTGFVLRGDADAETPPPSPRAVLLPSLDSSVIGWKVRDWYLGPHGPALFDTNGNAGPTVWWDGRVVGGWAQRADGEIVTRLLEDVGSDAAAAVRAEAERLAAWIGDVRVTPRFRTPLERELSA